LTPSLNQGRWLGRNLASVAAQTYPNIEHIVMDGGSTDSSLRILQQSRGVRWTSKTDHGQSHALNGAYAASHGDIIGWLNADDAYFTTESVATAVTEFALRPNAAVVYGHAVLVDADDNLLHFLWVPRYSKRLLWRYNYIFQPAAFIRRSALGERLVHEDFESWMDRELWLRLAQSHSFSRIDDVLAVDRHHPFRKSYLRDLAEIDRQKVINTYGASRDSPDCVTQRLLRVALRLRGVTLIVRQRSSVPMDVVVGPARRIFLNQVAMRRDRMGQS
jgi:glycosyltransferase involved in cell wall biosynthesis